MKNVFFSIFVILFLVIIVNAQKSYQFQHFGVKDGLSQSNVHAIFQDSRGFIWIGTNKGLNKFNGQDFEVFMPSSDSLKIGLAHQSVYDIIEDSEGNLWIATRDGVSKYDPKLGTFKNFQKTGNCNGCLAGQIVKKLIEIPPYVYVGSSAGLSRIHTVTDEVKGWWYTDGSDGIPYIYSIRDFELLPNGSLMMATDDGLAYYNPKTDSYRTITAKDGLPDAGNGIEAIFKDSSNQYWLGMSRSGVVRLIGDPNNPQFVQLPMQEPNGIPSHTVYEIVEHTNGVLLIGSHSGIVQYKIKTDTYEYLKSNPGSTHSISDNEAKNLYIDSEDRLWVAGNYGLDVYDPYVNQFEIIGYSSNPEKGLTSNNITALHQDQTGAIWIGNSETGVTVFEEKNGIKSYHHIDAENGSNTLSDPVVYEISEDNDGNIFIVTGNGINKIVWHDRGNLKYTISTIPIGPISEQKLPTPYVNLIYEDQNNSLWFATHGKGIVNKDNFGKFTQYRYELQDPNYLSGDYVTHVIQDEKGNFYVSNSGSGFSYLNVVGQDTVYRKFKAKTPFNRVQSFNVTLHQNKLFANTSVGSYFFSNKEELHTKENATYKLYNESNGLPDNSVMKVVPVTDSTYWFSTGNGLAFVNTQQENATPYKYIAGARNVEFARNSGLMSSDSTIYFGSLKGVVRFKPKEFQKNTKAPRLYFSEFKIWNKSVPVGINSKNNTTLPKNIDFLRKVTLQPEDKVFSVDMNAVNFTLPQEIHYAYKLEGFDEDWNYTENNNITRSNLEPGTYTLLAKAANNDWFWSEPISLKIEILPPWYLTWWAYLLFALLCAGAVSILLKIRLQQERRVELARSQERDIFRKRSSRDFHDEAGTKITRISLITELARLENSDNKPLQSYLDQIEENVQDLNHGMRDFIWTLDPTKDNAYDTFTRYIEFAGNFCEYANVKFQSQVISEDLKSKELNMAERRHLLMILKEATNNCIKHGNPTIINFEVNYRPKSLKIILKDNGRGFDVDKEKRGNGLNNMKERAEALGGVLKIESKINDGTTLLLTLQTTRLGN